MDLSEKRQHQRLEISYPITLKVNEKSLSGFLSDISVGGAKVEIDSDQVVPFKHQPIELCLTIPEKFSISVFCEVKRERTSEKTVQLGLQFKTQNSILEKQISELFHFFLSENQSELQPKISHRLPIRFGALSDLEAIVENISMGGVALTVDHEFELYDEVELSIPNMSGDELLVVKGKIMHQYPMDNPQYFRIGVEFQDLSEPSKRCLKELMYEILELSVT